MLPARAPKKQKRSARWKSQAHRTFVRKEFVCCNCGSHVERQAAHVRINSGAGIGEKPDDWRVVPLCHECHSLQHRVGEVTFWNQYKRAHGQTVEQLIDELCAASPKRREIADIRKERERV